MSYDVYSGQFLAGHGVPVLIITSPISNGSTNTIECHVFFSGNTDSYALYSGEYESEDESMIDDADIIQAVKQNGEEHLYRHLAKINSNQYQAMLAGYGYKMTEADNNFLLQLHLRNFLSFDIEKKISNNTKDSELKSILKQYSQIGRITSTKKI